MMQLAPLRYALVDAQVTDRLVFITMASCQVLGAHLQCVVEIKAREIDHDMRARLRALVKVTSV